METLRNIVRRLPIVRSVLRAVVERYQRFQLASKDTEGRFTYVVERNAWRGSDSVSGTGSDFHQTRIVAKRLPEVFREFDISTMLDVPCGDFHWMKNVDLAAVDYTGADIVRQLVRDNSGRYTSDKIRFVHLNLITDRIPDIDLIFCRDCLVHFSIDDIMLALQNISRSNAKYLLTTTFPDRQVNTDILTGQWRVLNLQAAPFSLPEPIWLANEGCTESDGAYQDKAIALWRVADIRESLGRDASDR